MPGRAVLLAAVLLAVAVPPPLAGQEIRESDLYFSDPANLARLLEEARAAQAAGQARLALDGVTTVVETARDNLTAEAIPVLVRALLLRAELRLAAGNRAGAASDLEEALRFDPEAAPEPADRRPFARLFRESRSRRVSRLTVTSEPPGARVTVEGRVLGLTPLGDAPVGVGKRFVKVERAGFAAVESEVEVLAGRPARLAVTLERRAATLLVLSNAEGAVVEVDGAEVGVARRPDADETQSLIEAYNLPIDPYQPPALFHWREAVPGEHLLELEAPCHAPARRTIDIAASADTTVMVPLEAARGSLRLEGPAAATVSLDGAERGSPPLLLDDLCPGPHRLEASDAEGRRTQVTLRIPAGRPTEFTLRFLPVLAWLGGDPALRDRLGRLAELNLVEAEGMAGADPARLVVAGDEVDRAARDLIAAATGADLLGWSTSGAAGAELVLLAAAAARPERLPAGDEAARERAARALDQPLPLTRVDLGLAAVDTALAPHPLVAALDEEGPGFRAGLKVGDELLALGGTELASLADLERVARALTPGRETAVVARRTTGSSTLLLTPRAAADDPDFARLALPASAAIARAGAASASAEEAPRLAFVRGKAFLALGDWEQALASLASAELPPGSGVGPGTVLYYRGLAALRAGRRDEARAALGGALRHPGARLLGPDGPPALPLVQDLLGELGPAAEDD